MFIAAAGLLLLAGCGQKDKTVIALITDGGTIQDQSVNQSAWEGVEKFSKEFDKTSGYYEPKERSTRGYEEAINEALEGGAEVVICPGKVFETAVYDMQKEDLSVKFLLLDGVPHAKGSDREKLRGNAHAVLFSREQAGFMAGYAAVWEGYTNLGFLGGTEDDATIRYGSGFVQGANAAAEEKGLNADQVVIYYRYLGTEVISPSVAKAAEAWYDSGCQVIFGCDNSILNAIGKAAEEKGKLVISAESRLEAFSGSVLTYVENAYEDVVYQMLKSIEDGEYAGGEKETVGIESSSVGLDMARSSFQTFTPEQYTTVCNRIKSGELAATGENVTKDLAGNKIRNVTVMMEN